jgi:lipopolysaccharide/colanic/teichoic acid biosynthesis glycosyltransferase
MTEGFSSVAPMRESESDRAADTSPARRVETAGTQAESPLLEDAFHSVLALERKRAERSRKLFVLMLMDAHLENGSAAGILREAVKVVIATKRETDLTGWYKQGAILGVIFTEVNAVSDRPITDILRAKFETILIAGMGKERAARIATSFHVFPETWDRTQSAWQADTKLYPELSPKAPGKKLPLFIKRVMDIAGAAALLLVLSPLLAAIAALIKLTSKGPVIFEQERLGRFGARFKCLKFRTMYTNNDPKIHQEYIQQFISGKEECGNGNGSHAPIYKIVNDPRVTAVGRFLRKTSLDELPQFWNVLRGEMSLVGPRPPVPYEFEIYDIWHRRRILDVKPGVTGLWQVSGRSRTRFDEMVRLDLRYCQNWSLWLDVKILISTPRAVFGGDGAY